LSLDIEFKKVFLISLGCAKNIVDSENMLGLVKQKGHQIVSSIDKAEVAIINTCGFIQSAVEECIDTILEVLTWKEKGKLEKLIVAGCFVQRYGYKLRQEIPEVDSWLGTGEIHRIADLITHNSCQPPLFFIGRPISLANHSTPRIQTTPFYSAYLKIAEGCSHRCSFCTIPGIRGPFKSRDLSSILIEANEMAGNGVKEINLIAQDSTMYGKDLCTGIGLEALLEKLVDIKGLQWIRVLYSHPFGISDRLLELIRTEERICSYLDMPFQHANEQILRSMRREIENEKPLELIERLRSMPSRISLRTTLIVGFPGETDIIFRELYDFVKAAKFDHLGVFPFSPENGTAAARLKNIPGHEVADDRYDKIMRLQKKISKRNNQHFVGKVIPVLIEGTSPETDLLLTGRTTTMAPDVDGQVLINKGHGEIGRIMPTLITEAHSYDLIGEIIEEGDQSSLN